MIIKVAGINVFISHSTIPKNEVLTKLLDICRIYKIPKVIFIN